MMVTVTLILLVILILPFILLGVMWALEIIADLLFIMVRLIDKITGYKTEKRFIKNNDESRFR